jgi:hypothetical protein
MLGKSTKSVDHSLAESTMDLCEEDVPRRRSGRWCGRCEKRWRRRGTWWRLGLGLIVWIGEGEMSVI